MIEPGDFGPRPFPPSDEEPTNPINPPPERKATPLGGFLTPLGARVDDPFPDSEAPTPAVRGPHGPNKHMRNYLALSPEDRKLVDAFTIRLREGAGR